MIFNHTFNPISFAAIFLLLFSPSAYAAVQTSILQGATIQNTAVVSATNSLLLEDASYLLHENSDTMQLES